MANPEHLHGAPERSAESVKDFERAPEVLDKKLEHTPESKQEREHQVEEARKEVHKEALSGHETSGHEQQHDSQQHVITHRTRDESYRHTMKRIQNEMSAPARVFSKVIHNKTVERVSDTVGSSVARPDAILSGSFFAFVAVLGLYILAKYNGFSLSGFETIGAFIVGWVVGIVFDLLRGTIKRKR